MSYLWKSSLCVVVLVGAGILAAGTPRAQDPLVQEGAGGPKPDAPGNRIDVPALNNFARDPNALSNQSTGGPFNFRVGFDRSTVVEYEAAVAAFRGAPNGAEKEATKAELRKKLVEIFDADMKARKAQSEEIEARLKKVQEQNKAREAAKDSIIDLQLQVLEKDADGLGFPKGEGATGGNPLSGGSRNRHDPLLRENSADWPVQRNSKENRQQPLQELLKNAPKLVEELMEKKLYVESADGKSYAYANVNYPNGPSAILLVESRTGKLLGESNVKGAVKQLMFSDEGVSSSEGGGVFTVRIPLPNSTTAKPTVPAPIGMAARAESAFGDYETVRRRYSQAVSEMKKAQVIYDDTAEADRKEKRETTVEAMKERYGQFWTYQYGTAKEEIEIVSHLLHAKLKLLDLDVQSAKATLNVAEAAFASAESVNRARPDAINDAELNRLRQIMEKAKIEVERANTIFSLFESIKKESTVEVKIEVK